MQADGRRPSVRAIGLANDIIIILITTIIVNTIIVVFTGPRDWLAALKAQRAHLHCNRQGACTVSHRLNMSDVEIKARRNPFSMGFKKKKNTKP